jgi:hypothetical protein
MKTETIKIYISEDGERFSDQAECRDYEINLHKMKSIQDLYLHRLPENKVEIEQFESGLCYIQHKPEHFERYKQDIFEEICMEYVFNIMCDHPFQDKEKSQVLWNEYKLFSDKVFNTETLSDKLDGLEYLEQYFKYRKQFPYIDAWKRVINTDNQYREWFAEDLAIYEPTNSIQLNK